jgi:ketosteroid isomerase-like protein
MRRLAAIVAVCMMCTCAVWGQAPKQDPTPVLQADRDFNKATQERKLEGWMQYMADNIVLGHEDQPNFGKDAVRKAMAFLNEPDASLTWDPITGEVFPSGTIGYTTGAWTSKGKNKEGKEVTRTGRYLTVWKKQKDGSWKAVWDGGAADPRPTS